jgi:TatD DNase family protein
MTPPGPATEVELVDTHAHLQESELCHDLPGVLGRARDAGVVQVVAIGVNADDSRNVVTIARSYPGTVFAAVGVQPNYAAEAVTDDWKSVVALAGTHGVVALGETGLDRYWDHTPFPVQQDWFDRHLTLAQELGLPVVIHCRDCERDIVKQLARMGRSVRGVLHSFTGTWDDAQAFLELGLHVSFAGMVTFANRKLDALRDVAARVPLDRLLVETDSPYLSPHPFRGKTNEPGRVALTAQRIAELRGVSFASLAAATTANARRLFGLPGLGAVGAR